VRGTYCSCLYFLIKISRKMYLFSNRPDYTWIDHVESTHTSCTARVETVFQETQLRVNRWRAPSTFYTTTLNKPKKNILLARSLARTGLVMLFAFVHTRWRSYAPLGSLINPALSPNLPSHSIALDRSSKGHQPSCRLLPPASSLQLPPINPAT